MPQTEPSPVCSHNEWDPLEEVIVGSAQGAIYPEFGPIAAANGEPTWLKHYQAAFVEQELVDEAEAQLSGLVQTLESAGVTVRRPDPIPHAATVSTPFWQCRGGWNTANPRDLFLVVGDQIIECASPNRHRHFEALAYRRVLGDYFARGARWVAAPPAVLSETLYDYSMLLAGPAQVGPPIRYPINESEPVWEAADFVRCGADIVAMRSNVTNLAGIEWVRRHLGDAYRVHRLETSCPTPCHIDTTFIPLRPGLALVHPQWVGALPDGLRDWETIKAPAPRYRSDSPMAEPYFTSQWLSMNVLSLDANRVLVDDQQTVLIDLLSTRGFEPLPLPFDAVGAFGGSFHCVTLDVRRRAEGVVSAPARLGPTR